MRKEYRIYKIEPSSIPYIGNIRVIDQDNGEHFTSRKEAEEHLSRAFDKGDYTILEVIVIED